MIVIYLLDAGYFCIIYYGGLGSRK